MPVKWVCMGIENTNKQEKSKTPTLLKTEEKLGTKQNHCQGTEKYGKNLNMNPKIFNLTPNPQSVPIMEDIYPRISFQESTIHNVCSNHESIICQMLT